MLFKKYKLISAVIIVTLVLSFTSCYLFPKEEKILAPPLTEPAEISYNVIEVEKGDIEKKIAGSGTFISVKQANHCFKYRGGRLKTIHVTIGDAVKKGGLLAELDTDNLESEIAQQNLVLTKAQLNHEKLKSQMNDKSAIALASIDIEGAELKFDNLEKELQQARKVAGVSGIASSKDKIADLETQIKQQNLTLRKLKINYERLKNNSDKYFALATAQADVELAELKLNNLKREEKQSKLEALIDGKIVYINNQVSNGDYISSYQTLISIADPERLQLQYSGYNNDQFSLGMKVDVTIDEKKHEGIVVMTPINLPYDADDSLRDKIRIQVKNLPDDVRMGDYAGISVILEKKDNVIVLMRNVIRTYLGRRYVQILENGIKQERDVKIGIETATEVEVVKGLEVGEKVIIR